jgi:hypothetical protein
MHTWKMDVTTPTISLATMAIEPPEPDPTAKRPARSRPRLEQSAPSVRSMVDQMSEHSFPASDPPAVWTWDVGNPPLPHRRGED